MKTTCRRLLALVGPAIIAYPVFAQTNDTMAIKEQLRVFLAGSANEPALYEDMCRTGQIHPYELRWATVDKEQLVACCIKRVPPTLNLSARKSLVNGMLVATLLRLQSVHSSEIEQILSRYQYADLLVDYAGGRLVQRTEGQIFGLPAAIIYAETDQYISAFVRLPQEAVIASTIDAVSSEDATLFYKTALIRTAKQKMAAAEFEEAVRLMLEAFKFGYKAKSLLVDLFTCYVRSGHKEDGLRASQFVLESYSAKLSFDDCVEMASVAEAGDMSECADTWYQQAEQRVRHGFSMDLLVE